MKVCFVSPEYFRWGTYGGFGFLTKMLATEIAKKGHEVSVITPRRVNQKECEEIDKVKIFGFPMYSEKPCLVNALRSKLKSLHYYREVDADIYHSQAISYNTFLAEKTVPDKIHITTFQDPYDENEWGRIAKVDKRYKSTLKFKARIKIENMILKKACHNADALYTQAKFLSNRAKNLFKLEKSPRYLPNPVIIPNRSMKKSLTPTMCFLARWDPQKRVELFFNLASKFPGIEFIAMGKAHNERKDAELRKKYSKIPNLKMTGFVSEEEKSKILEKSWALINTSIREALPVSFLEALAHETPIISGEDPDQLTSIFGYKVVKDNFSATLEELFQSDERIDKGKQGREHMKKVYDVDKVVHQHIQEYRKLLEV